MAMPSLIKTKHEHIRQNPKTGEYWVDKKIGRSGRRFRRKCGSLERAKLLLTQVEEVARRPNPTRLSQLCERFRAYDEAHNNGYEQHDAIERRFIKDLGNPKTTEITPAMISDWQIKELGRGLKASSINRATRRLHAVLNLAVRDRLLTLNPMRGYKLLREAPGRLRWMTEEEEARGEAVMSVADWRLVRIAFLSGMRQSEQFSLETDQLRWDANLIHLDRTKNNETRDVPMGADLREALELQRKLGRAILWTRKLPCCRIEKLRVSDLDLVYFLTGDWDGEGVDRRTAAQLCQLRMEFNSEPRPDHRFVCVNPKTGRAWVGNQFYKYRFRPAMEAAQIVGLRWHDLRHTYCSRLAMAGIPIRTIQRMAGHKTIQITERYSHLSQEHLHAAARALDRK